MAKQIILADFDESGVISKSNIPKGYRGKADIVSDNVQGDKNSPVVLVEYLDFQCPFCRALAPVIGVIIRRYEYRVAFVMRYFPLPQHTNAVPAAAAVEAAARQGGFAAMSRLVFMGQPDWQDLDEPELLPVFKQYATQAKLDVKRWTDDYRQAGKNGILAKIGFQFNLGALSGVEATPTVRINGYQLDNPTEPNIIEALDTELKHSR